MTDAMFAVLVVEDDRDIRNLLRTLLEAEGYRVTVAESAQRALVEARSHRPDVVIVDLGLPDRDGQAVIREIRSFSPIPIVVLSARTMETEKIKALDAGADDYVTKPFSSPELLARVRAALRRKTRAASPRPVQLGSLNIDLVTRKALGRDGSPIHLTPLEFRLLECLASANGLIVTQDHIIREVWGPERTADTRNLRVYVKMLRQKLEPNPQQPQYIVTEAGVGYRLRADVPAVEEPN